MDSNKIMSVIKTNLRLLFGKLWGLQFFIIGVLILYSILATVSIFALVNNQGLIPNNYSQSDNTVIVSIIFESNDSQKVINWNPVVAEVKTNSTLLSVMNATLTINGTLYGNSGYYLTSINSLRSDLNDFWTYYYFTKGSGWVYSLVGISSFILNHDYQIKWIYGPASS